MARRRPSAPRRREAKRETRSLEHADRELALSGYTDDAPLGFVGPFGMFATVPRIVGSAVVGFGVLYLGWRFLVPASWKAKMGGKVSTAFNEAQKAALRQVMPKGTEYLVDLAFEIGAETDVSPLIILGITGTESAFGLTKSLKPQGPTGTGDFIPRKATADLDAFMAKNPLPGAVRKMAVDPRDKAAGEVMAWVPTTEGWGHGLYQLDWRYHSDFIKTGKWKDPREAMRYMAKNIYAKYRNEIRSAVPGLSTADLTRATIASYNAGSKRVIRALKSGTDLNTTTFVPNYVQHVLDKGAELVAKAGISA